MIAAAGLHALGGALHSGSGPAAIVPMLVIGIGAGMPWGLMDGLSVSVVPTSRAGMATGIFSTTRVAGEGVALALVSALLAVLVQVSLHETAPHADPAGLAAAAARLAMADLAGAGENMPNVAQATLRAAYNASFGRLLDVLTAITLACALATLGFLSRLRVQDEPLSPHADETRAMRCSQMVGDAPKVAELAPDRH